MSSSISIAEPDGLAGRRRLVAVAALSAALVLVVLDGAIANIALPTIAGALSVSPSKSVWVVTSYQMALVISLLPVGALGESLGHRRVFLAGTVLFGLASAGCAFAPSLLWLVIARFVQGFGGAALMALNVALLRFVYPQRMLGTAIGRNALIIALTSAAAPTIGASILSIAPWPVLFAVNIPVAIVVLLTGKALPEIRGSGRRIDGLSVGLNAVLFGALVVGAEGLLTRPVLALALVVIGVVCLALLVRRERGREAPLIPLDLLRAHAFRISVMASVCCFAGQMASAVALPFYLQHGLGKDAFTTGLFLTPWPLAVAVAAPLSGRWSDRVGTGWLCAAGGATFAVGLALAAIWPMHHSALPLIPFMAIAGLGFGFFQTPNNRNMLLSAPKARSGAAGGMQGTARLTGQTIGAVIVALLLTLGSGDLAPRFALGVAAALTLASGLISVLRVPARGEGAAKVVSSTGPA